MIEKKKVIICIHGFKTGAYHDFDFFKSFCDSRNDLFSGEVKLINLYDLDDIKSYKNGRWGNIALNQVKYYQENDYEIFLIGYSMGCGIAAYVASKIEVSKLVLIAPFHHLLGSKMLTHNIKLIFKMLKFRIKYRKRLKRFKKASKKTISIRLLLNIVLSVKKYKKYVKRVKCSSLILLGLQDDYVPMRSANYAFRKIRSNNKQLWFIDHVNHLFIFSKQEAPVVFLKILDFINGSQIMKIY